VVKPYPAEFRRDVIAVARKGEASIAQIARFGILLTQVCHTAGRTVGNA
jgi:transposase-like protein